uniref:Uncharacterized protein n=1 Tax=Rhizophora mucronata TaxID=61149 RepID=A0A2P2L1U5_RHIMU
MHTIKLWVLLNKIEEIEKSAISRSTLGTWSLRHWDLPWHDNNSQHLEVGGRGRCRASAPLERWG